MKLAKYLFIFLSLNYLFSAQVLSADCNEVNGDTKTISTSCTDLDITGDSSNVTINSGVTIDERGGGSWTAIGLSDTTNTTITNNGTISTTQNWTLRNNGTSAITNLTNNGTISAGSTSAIRNNGSITALTNTGTISATGDNGIKNNKTGTIGDITNSGTISANRYGLRNGGTITTISNSGTFSADSNYAISNTGSIGTFTNTGSITPTGNTGISNQGSITTFNNSQGKSGSNPVTFTKSLPTYYNVIVNSTSDYGQIEFSSISGNTSLNFDVDSTSTLAGSTTYSSVLSGLTSSNIASGTSDTFVSGSTRYPWTLSNSSGTLWDLVVAGNTASGSNSSITQNITPDTNTSVTTSVKPNVILGINNLTSVTEVNFANMNTYDCDLFDKNNICLSLGSRYTSINTPKTETNSAVLVGGYKLSDTLRVAGFYHSNLSHKTPASFTLSDKTPMIGAVVVWNQNPNKLGYQLKLANAYQQKNATLTREVVSTSEEGKGQTVIEAKSYVAELQYGYQYGDNTVLHPYLAARSAVIKQDAYTETGLSSPLSFNEIKDKSTTILLGLKFNTRLSHNLTLKGSLGVEHDIEHSVDKLAPTGISGLSTVSLTDSFNKTRPVVSLGFDYELKPNHRLSGILQYQELPYESKTESNAYLYYTIGF